MIIQKLIILNSENKNMLEKFSILLLKEKTVNYINIINNIESIYIYKKKIVKIFKYTVYIHIENNINIFMKNYKKYLLKINIEIIIISLKNYEHKKYKNTDGINV